MVFLRLLPNRAKLDHAARKRKRGGAADYGTTDFRKRGQRAEGRGQREPRPRTTDHRTTDLGPDFTKGNEEREGGRGRSGKSKAES
jgi:hypothetical protein